MLRTPLSRPGARLLSRFSLSLSVSLGACVNLSPSSAPPAIALPAHYTADPLPASGVPADGVAQTFRETHHLARDWWLSWKSAKMNALVSEGLQHNAHLASAEYAMNATRETVLASIRASGLPAVDTSLSARRIGNAPDPKVNVGTNQIYSDRGLYDNYSASILASYTVDWFGASRMANAGRLAQAEQQNWEWIAARQSLTTQIIITVINASALRAQYADAARCYALAQQEVLTQAARFALGATNDDTLRAARTDASNVRSSLVAYHRQYQTARQALAVLLGRRPDEAPGDAELPAFDSLVTPVDLPVAIPSELLAQRADIQASAAALRVAAAQVGVAAANRLPSLTLYAGFSAGRSPQPVWLDGPSILWAIAGSVSAPVFRGGALRAAQHAAEQRYKGAQAAWRETVLNAFHDVADKMLNLSDDAQALQAAQDIAQNQQQNWKNQQLGLRLGAVSESNLRMAERQYLNAQEQARVNRAQRLSDTARLFEAMGNFPDTPVVETISSRDTTSESFK